MNDTKTDRRKFIKTITGSAAVLSALPGKAFGLIASRPVIEVQGNTPQAPKVPVRIKFAVIGINHDHIHGQIGAVQRGGGELVSFYAKEPELIAAFTKRYPN